MPTDPKKATSTGAASGGPVRLGWRWWVLFAYWGLMYLGTHWPEIERYRPATGWWIPHFGLVVHLGLYGLWGALWWWVLTTRAQGASYDAYWGIVWGGLAYAMFDEGTQLIIGRSGKLSDVLIDVIGVAIAVWGLTTLRALGRRMLR
jgi:VanZ family protein